MKTEWQSSGIPPYCLYKAKKAEFGDRIFWTCFGAKCFFPVKKPIKSRSKRLVPHVVWESWRTVNNLPAGTDTWWKVQLPASNFIKHHFLQISSIIILASKSEIGSFNVSWSTTLGRWAFQTSRISRPECTKGVKYEVNARVQLWLNCSNRNDSWTECDLLALTVGQILRVYKSVKSWAD